MPGNPLNVIIFSSVPPRQVAVIIARIGRDAPEARVCGVLYERRPPKTLQQRIDNWRKKMKRFAYWRYVAHRIGATLERYGFDLLNSIIRFIHAAPKWPNGKVGYGLDDLGESCKQIGAEFCITRDIHSDEALDFVRRMNADLGLVFGTRILKPTLYTIPRQGSINIHKRKVPDYRGGGAVFGRKENPRQMLRSWYMLYFQLPRRRRCRTLGTARRSEGNRSHSAPRGGQG